MKKRPVPILAEMAISSRPALPALESRAIATSRVLKGGALALGGVALFATGAFVGVGAGALGYLGLTVGGAAVFGVGALMAGRAATHLVRFGDPRSSKVLMATAGLGASVVAFVVTHLFQILGWTPVGVLA